MMRIAIAGGGGFSYILAQELTQTANAVLVISRQVSYHPLATYCLLLTIASRILSLKKPFPDARRPW